MLFSYPCPRWRRVLAREAPPTHHLLMALVPIDELVVEYVFEAGAMKRCLILRSTPLGMMLTVTLRMLPLLNSLILKLLTLKLMVLKLRQAKCMLDITSAVQNIVMPDLFQYVI